jgi:CRP/FNR family transcriptional regulator, cyclic AMP receptor protein
VEVHDHYDPPMPSMLDLAADLPEIAVAAGHVLCAEGDPAGPMWVLVEGSLVVSKSGATVNAIEQPGAVIGEVGVLLGRPFTATVVAATPCRLRHATDGIAFLLSDPAISMFVAAGLAERLDVVTTYLADLENQYGDAPGIAMVGQVLRQLAGRQGPPARPGSARDPDPEY